MDHFAASRGCNCHGTTIYETKTEDDWVVRKLRERLRQRRYKKWMQAGSPSHTDYIAMAALKSLTTLLNTKGENDGEN